MKSTRKHRRKSHHRTAASRRPILPGMKVEATQGDLGEEDVSQARVAGVERNRHGRIEKLKISKGFIFRKQVEVPADRIEAIEAQPGGQASDETVKISADEQELEALSQPGSNVLPPEEQKSMLDQVEQRAPTAEGLRELEKDIPAVRAPTLLRTIGPGLLSGMAGNDASAVTAYALNGAAAGYRNLWLLVLSTPLYLSVQYACARIGRISQKGLAELLRERYGRSVAIVVTLLLLITNVALIGADLVAISSGLELLSGITWFWFVVPVAAILWYLTVYRNFESLKKIFLAMSFAFVAYVLAALFVRANWQAVLVNTFVPHLDFSFTSISSAIALLGATISPYSMFWQVQGEKEQERPGTLREQIRGATVDVSVGVISGNLVAYFVIVCAAATLYTHHMTIHTALDLARSLGPLSGPFARYLFAAGLIGAGVVAVPVLMASSAYAVAGMSGWPAGLSKRPWQNEGFYLALSAVLLAGLLLALIGIEPIQLIFWANVVTGILAPLLIVTLLLVGNSGRIMHQQRLSLLNNACLLLTVLILLIAVVVLFFELLTGQSGA
ncbi:MAG: divalent metal cation transporter [Ktedonobacteraceae bacterium]|nr:divalent metal cation transporter [Ktedonobacteraceae bacterium]